MTNWLSSHRSKIFLRNNFTFYSVCFAVKYLVKNKIFSSTKQLRQICIKCFTLEILIKHFTFLCTLLAWYSTCFSHSYTLLVFSWKLSPSWSFSPIYHRQHLRHYSSLAPPFASATHHWFHYHWLYLSVFFFFSCNPPLLLLTPPFLGTPSPLAHPQVLTSNFFYLLQPSMILYLHFKKI